MKDSEQDALNSYLTVETKQVRRWRATSAGISRSSLLMRTALSGNASILLSLRMPQSSGRRVTKP